MCDSIVGKNLRSLSMASFMVCGCTVSMGCCCTTAAIPFNALLCRVRCFHSFRTMSPPALIWSNAYHCLDLEGEQCARWERVASQAWRLLSNICSLQREWVLLFFLRPIASASFRCWCMFCGGYQAALALCTCYRLWEQLDHSRISCFVVPVLSWGVAACNEGFVAVMATLNNCFSDEDESQAHMSLMDTWSTAFTTSKFILSFLGQ